MRHSCFIICSLLKLSEFVVKVFWLVGKSLTALLTQFRSCCAFKVKTIVNIKDLIEINSWSKVNEKEEKNYIYTISKKRH